MTCSAPTIRGASTNLEHFSKYLQNGGKHGLPNCHEPRTQTKEVSGGPSVMAEAHATTPQWLPELNPWERKCFSFVSPYPTPQCSCLITVSVCIKQSCSLPVFTPTSYICSFLAYTSMPASPSQKRVSATQLDLPWLTWLSPDRKGKKSKPVKSQRKKLSFSKQKSTPQFSPHLCWN